MKFSSQEEYGLRCLLQLAQAGPDASLTIGEISRQEGITEPYVAKLMNLLRKGELVASTRGQSGGYKLARPPEAISLREVLDLLGGRLYEDDFCDRHSGHNEVCAHSGGCSIRPVWDRVQRAVDHVLGGITIQSLIDGIEEPNVAFGAPRPKVGASL